ncbi:MAG: 4Fe-4S ferredoxin iron-sulfur binding domain protein, partial [Firmicutes bacterium]|nr:4Fe-4S ferredoxin iron-sulfur binding domain protein [Bacillota bacterium]
GTIQILQYVLLAAGAFGSVYTAYRIAKNNYSTKVLNSALPFIVLIIVLTLANVYFFMLPMTHRM